MIIKFIDYLRVGREGGPNSKVIFINWRDHQEPGRLKFIKVKCTPDMRSCRACGSVGYFSLCSGQDVDATWPRRQYDRGQFNHCSGPRSDAMGGSVGKGLCFRIIDFEDFK